MKRIQSILKSATAITTFLLASVSVQAAPVQVINGDFESGFTNRTPNGWTAIKPTGESHLSFGGNTSPAGGAYWGLGFVTGWGSRFNKEGIFQTIDNLVVGATYELSFYSMGNHTNSAQTEHWEVQFGDEEFVGATVDASSRKWVKSTTTFTATQTSQTLRFAAIFLGGIPGASPEILNLDGVSLTQKSTPPDVNNVPEPASLALMLIGLAGVGAAARRRKTQATS